MRSLSFLFLLLFATVGSAQNQALRQFTIDDGLPSNHVYEVKQDSKGFYWIATDHGVVKYDGYRFIPFDGPFSKDIWWTYEDSKGRIWGLSKGTDLTYLEHDSFKVRSLSCVHTGPKTAFQTLHQDNFGNYWLLAGSRLHRFNEDSCHTFDNYSYFIAPRKQMNHSYPEIIEGDSNEFYFITKYPVTVWRANEEGLFDKVYSYPDTLFSVYTHFEPGVLSGQPPPEDREFGYCDFNISFVPHSPDSLFIVRNGRVRGLIKGKAIDLGPLPDPLGFEAKSNRVTKLKNKYAFINSSKSFVTDHRFNRLVEYDFLSKLQINTVYEDNEKGLWISTVGQGLYYISQDALATRSYEPTDSDQGGVTFIGEDERQNVWAGFQRGAIVKLTNTKVTTYMVHPKGKRDSYWTVRQVEIIGNLMVLMIGHYEVQLVDLDELNKGIYKPVVFSEFENLKNMTVDGDGNVILTDFWGIWYLDLRNKSLKLKKRSMAVSTFEDSNGNELTSSYLGVYLKKKGADSTLVCKTQATCFRGDRYGRTWIYQQGRGIQYFDENYLLKDVLVLRNMFVRDIWFDSDSVAFAATNEGLFKLRYNRTTDQYAYHGKLTMANGLLTNDVTAIYTDSTFLYVGTAKGLNVIDRRKLSDASKGHNVILTNARSRGRELVLDSVFILEPDNNALELDYVYISPKSDGQITYEYKLEGIDDEWQTTDETRVNYPFLPAGDYRFELRAKDINGIPSTENINLKITVKQHWWETTWFFALAFLSGIASITGFFMIRFRQLRKREQERTEMNNRIAELKLNALQSQMNPHFVFNVLNSIQDAFVSNNVMEANRYMTDFSKLMRLFLESSDDKFITLSKEIKLLSYYMELERMRLDKKFEFEFLVDDDLDTDHYRIPTMILQPIVENAILHGLRYKEGEGKLSILFKLEEDDGLLVSIEDNGVGRKRSAEINTTRRKDHVSKAASIIEERIQIINSGSNDHIEMHYIDLEDDNGPIGTRVELKLKLEINR
ncbi:MAG: hypothetical protein GC178_15195 [Flavobacteriales bacterium]|nr:hypothetical protein [Flavobacteriales bacterium]